MEGSTSDIHGNNTSKSGLSCAYCIETLNSCISSEIQAPPYLRKHFSDKCMKVSSYSTNVLKELALTIMKMKKSSNIDLKVAEMNFAVQELKDALKSLPKNLIASAGEELTEAATIGKGCIPSSPFVKVLPLVTVVSLLVEMSARIGGVADAVEKLASRAEFKPAEGWKTQAQPSYPKITIISSP